MVGLYGSRTMDASDIKKLLEDTRRAEEELRKDREALERVARLLKLSEGAPSQSGNGHQELNFPVRAKTISDAIREAIIHQQGEFTVRDIYDFLVGKYSEMEPKKRYTTISSVLGSLKGKSVRVVRSGTGVPNVFIKI